MALTCMAEAKFRSVCVCVWGGGGLRVAIARSAAAPPPGYAGLDAGPAVTWAGGLFLQQFRWLFPAELCYRIALGNCAAQELERAAA
jgi:hypothetical protein